MKYIAIFDDDMLCNFRRDDNGLTLVLRDSLGFERGVALKPLIKPVIVADSGVSAYLTDGHIKAFLDYEQYERIKKIWNIKPDEKSTES
jgi:hypothetical protein